MPPPVLYRGGYSQCTVPQNVGTAVVIEGLLHCAVSEGLQQCRHRDRGDAVQVQHPCPGGWGPSAALLTQQGASVFFHDEIAPSWAASSQNMHVGPG